MSMSRQYLFGSAKRKMKEERENKYKKWLGQWTDLKKSRLVDML